MNITELKISDKKKVEYFHELLDEWQFITDVNYIVSELDKISLEKFGYDYRSFLKIYDLNINEINEYFKCLEKLDNGLSFSKLEKIKKNDLKVLNLLEYLKNLLFSAIFLKKIKEEDNKTLKERKILFFEIKIDKFLSFINFKWGEIYYNGNLIKIIDSKNLIGLLELNSIDSLDVTAIEWKNIVLDYMKKTTIKVTDHAKILRLISPTAEKYRKEVQAKNNDIANELFKNLNNLCIRHDNNWEQIKTLYNFKNRNDYFLKIKQTFQLFLLAMIIIDD